MLWIDRPLPKAFALVAALSLLAACSSGKTAQKPKTPKTMNLSVAVRLSGAANVQGDLTTCAGLGQFSDIRAKAKVVVSNQLGTPIAYGWIANGFGTNYFQNVLDECSFQIYVLGVPRAKGYTIAVGRHTPVPFTRAGLLWTNGHFGFDLNPPNVPNPVLPTTPTTKKKKG